MKKKWLLVFAIMFTAVSAIFAYGHERWEVENYVKEYESIASEYERTVNNFIRYESESDAQKIAYTLPNKYNGIAQKSSFYADELTNSDMTRISRAMEKIQNAMSKYSNFVLENSY